jgi:DNA-binding transcriptional regulator PaaX
MSKGIGTTQKKIVLLLWSGLALSLSRSPHRSLRIIRETAREWKRINERQLRKSVKALYRSRMIKQEADKNGRIKIILTKRGRQAALSYQIFNMEIKKPKTWDRKWRVVIFDIPEPLKKKREIIRCHLKRMSFFKLQKSVFVHPYDCCNEIEYLTEFYQLRKHVRFLVADYVDNELHLKQHFGLLRG